MRNGTRLLLIMVLMVIPLMTGCGNGGNDLLWQPQTHTYTVSGQVTVDGSGLAGVTVTLAGAASASTVTNASGTFSFAQLANGSYTLTAAKAGYIVTPSSMSVTVDNADLPEQNFTALSASMAIAAGGFHSLALKGDGTVWAWGYNRDGQLGDGTTTNRTTPVQVSGLSGVTAIAAGTHHSLALKGDGTVWAWGGNWYGQLGDGTTTNSTTPVQVSGLSE
jgi:hypothetical protein